MTEGKISKSEANYTPLGDSKATWCSECTMFVAPSGCTLVEGKISPSGHCQHFEKRKQKT